MPIETLTDAADPRLDPYRIVRDPQLVRQSNRFLAEGRALVRTLLRCRRFAVHSVLLTPTALVELEEPLQELAGDIPCYVLEPDVLTSIGNIRFHQGCLAVAACPEPEAVASFCARQSGRLWLGFDTVGNPDNVGAVFRSARALGADAALLSATSCSPLYRKAIRSSMAASLVLPFLHAQEPWSDALATVAGTGRRIWALTPEEDAEPIESALADSDRDERRLLVLGAEGDGVGPETRAAAQRRVRIPMRAGVDSLNVAAAAAIALHLMGQSNPSVG